MTYGQLPTEHLASTGKQFDPTLRLVMIPRCRKTRWLLGKGWTWTSLRARRHRVLLNLDREWYHVMASSSLKHHCEQVPQ